MIDNFKDKIKDLWKTLKGKIILIVSVIILFKILSFLRLGWIPGLSLSFVFWYFVYIKVFGKKSSKNECKKFLEEHPEVDFSGMPIFDDRDKYNFAKEYLWYKTEEDRASFKKSFTTFESIEDFYMYEGRGDYVVVLGFINEAVDWRNSKPSKVWVVPRSYFDEKGHNVADKTGISGVHSNKVTIETDYRTYDEDYSRYKFKGYFYCLPVFAKYGSYELCLELEKKFPYASIMTVKQKTVTTGSADKYRIGRKTLEDEWKDEMYGASHIEFIESRFGDF